MNLRTKYLGLDLAHPLLPGAGPLSADLDSARRLEDAGAPCIILNSLFEEQLVMEQRASFNALESPADSFAEALSYLPEPDDYRLGPDNYLEHIRKLKESVSVPVIASVNGISPDGWREYPKLIADAGADAIEVNLYTVCSDPEESAAQVEERLIEAVTSVRKSVSIPIAVKLSQNFTSLPHFVRQLEGAGANGVVVFNRFYQPDIDIEELQTVPVLRLSDAGGLNIRLRWLAILAGRTSLDLSLSGCVHTSVDAIKGIMAGAGTVQLVSTLLRNGPKQLKNLLDGMVAWMEEHDYTSVDEMRGAMSHRNCPDPEAFERGNYAMILSSWRA